MIYKSITSINTLIFIALEKERKSESLKSLRERTLPREIQLPGKRSPVSPQDQLKPWEED